MKFADFKELVSKKPYDPFWVSRYLWRHITIPFSWLCSKCSIRADVVTIISLILGLVGALFYCWPTPTMFLLGTLFIQAWWFLDHVDGELARYEIKHLGRKPNLAGQYLDLLVHRWVQPLYHITMGIGILRMTGDWGYVILGVIAGSNFVGFTRSQADSIVLKSLASGNIDPNNSSLLELIELSNAVPSSTSNKNISNLKRLINTAKTTKTYFSFPACIVMLIPITIFDALVLNMEFPKYGPFFIGATLVYLILQAAISLAQNVAGTIYVNSLLRRMP